MDQVITSTGAHRFIGKTAIVVGGSANVGKALALLLARESADVVVHYNSASKQTQAEEVAAAVRGHGQEALIFQADLTKPTQATALFDAATATFGKVDILISTAGKIIRKPLPVAFFTDMLVMGWLTTAVVLMVSFWEERLLRDRRRKDGQ